MFTLSIGRKKRLNAVTFSPSGRSLAAVGGDYLLRVWDSVTGELRWSAPVEPEPYGFDLLFLAEDRLLLADAQLRQWDLATDMWEVVDARRRWGPRLARSPDGAVVLVVDQMPVSPAPLTLYDAATWARRPDPPDNTDPTGGVATGGAAFSADGRFLATGHSVRTGEKNRSAYGFQVPVPEYDYVVHVRAMPSGEIVRTIPGWQQGVRFLAFSPDGSTLVGTAGPRLRAWDLAADRELALHKRGTKHFQGLAFTAEGRRLLTIGNDTTVRVWDARTWGELTTLTWEAGGLVSLAVAPDGLRAAAGGDAGRVVVWDLE